jgi:hypothetical protein
MKPTTALFLPLLLLCIGAMACKLNDSVVQNTPDTNTMTNQIRIKVGSNTFTATLLDNPTVTAFRKQLPLKLVMTELNGNEKYAQLPNALPTNATNPGTIQTGDLLLYGNNTLVLFYETFRTSYTYTKIGRIDNPAGLATALGSGNATVTFELAEKP